MKDLNEKGEAGTVKALSASTVYGVAITLWCVATLLACLHLPILAFFSGMESVRNFIRPGPLSDIHVTMISVTLTWMLVGFFLGLLYLRRINLGNVVTLAGFFLIAFLYVNVVRERWAFGDVWDYIKAAENLRAGEPLHGRYLYPPFWANLLEFFAFLGEKGAFVVCIILNFLSLFAFYFLLHRALVRYGFSDRLAALTVVGFMAANVPILRTMLFVQVNLHVMNLILASLLLYPTRPWASALAMGLAVHMKASPAVLVLAFLFERDIRWLTKFVLCTLILGSITLAMHGVSPYLDFLNNAKAIYTANGINFRENSFDSLIRSFESSFSIDLRAAPLMIGLCKLLFAAAVLAVLVRALRKKAFSSQESPARNLDEAFPVLLIFMVMISPLVWEHHPVFLSLSYLVLLRALSNPAEWLVFGFAYFLEFLVPTFDFFPWSFGRLLSPLLWLWLAWTLSVKHTPSTAFGRMNDWVATLKLPRGVREEASVVEGD